MTTLNFLEECKRNNKTGKIALNEVGKEDERCDAVAGPMVYLRLDKVNNSDTDWKHEMAFASGGLAGQDYRRR